MRLKIDVTANDIKYGVQEDECQCAVARAVKRTLRAQRGLRKWAPLTAVPGRSVIWDDPDTDNVYRAPLPKKIQNFIAKFDNSKSNVSPVSFTLTIPKELN